MAKNHDLRFITLQCITYCVAIVNVEGESVTAGESGIQGLLFHTISKIGQIEDNVKNLQQEFIGFHQESTVKETGNDDLGVASLRHTVENLQRNLSWLYRQNEKGPGKTTFVSLQRAFRSLKSALHGFETLLLWNLTRYDRKVTDFENDFLRQLEDLKNVTEERVQASEADLRGAVQGLDSRLAKAESEVFGTANYDLSECPPPENLPYCVNLCKLSTQGSGCKTGDMCCPTPCGVGGMCVSPISQPRSCADIHRNRESAITGVYQLFARNKRSFEAFCDFYSNGVGYTFISRNDLNILRDLNGVATRSDHVIIRALRPNGIGDQLASNVEQLSFYHHRYPLSVFLNRYDGFARPVNVAMSPFIYLGFLPTEVAAARTTQGYRTAGVDVTFRNCDANPNSYFVLYQNPNQLRPTAKSANTPLMRKWLDKAINVPINRRMPERFFYFFEAHMGGCGGYITSNTVGSIRSAAIGFPFRKTSDG